MFFIKIKSLTDSSQLTLDESGLSKYVPSFVIFQAKKLGVTSTVIVNEKGQSSTWEIQYKPH